MQWSIFPHIISLTPSWFQKRGGLTSWFFFTYSTAGIHAYEAEYFGGREARISSGLQNIHPWSWNQNQERWQGAGVHYPFLWSWKIVLGRQKKTKRQRQRSGSWDTGAVESMVLVTRKHWSDRISGTYTQDWRNILKLIKNSPPNLVHIGSVVEEDMRTDGGREGGADMTNPWYVFHLHIRKYAKKHGTIQSQHNWLWFPNQVVSVFVHEYLVTWALR